MTRPLVSDLFAMNNVLDAEGRPLGEMRARAGLREGTVMELRRCPYPGHRHGLPMNVSALRQIQSRWGEVLATLAAVRRAVLGQERPVTREAEVLAIATGCMALAVCTHRRGEVPSGLEASVYKVAAGVHAVAMARWERACLQEAEGDAPTPTNILTFAEDTRRLYADGEACAGPPARLQEAMVAMLVEHPSPQAPRPPLGGEVVWALTRQQLAAAVASWLDQAWELRVLHEVVRRESITLSDPDPLRRRAAEQLPLLCRQRSFTQLLGALQRAWPDLLGASGGVGWQHTPPEPVAQELYQWLGHRPGGVALRPETRRWWADTALTYAAARMLYLQYIAREEQAVARALNTQPGQLTPLLGALFGRLHTNAWLDVLAGLTLEVHEHEAIFAHRGGRLEIQAHRLGL